MAGIVKFVLFLIVNLIYYHSNTFPDFVNSKDTAILIFCRLAKNAPYVLYRNNKT